MSQILNIFKKDVRHFWLEILASLAATIAFVKMNPYQWMPESHVAHLMVTIANIVTGLVPVTWWVLITRLIHDESLVGDRQFWITRPYQWQKLLAAKLLSVVVFLYLPFFVAQSVLLRVAGFHPLSSLPGLLFNLLFVTVILVLPVAALATVSSNFGKAALLLLVVVIYITGLAILSNFLPASDSPTDYGGNFPVILFCCLCVAAVLVQYATRNVRLSRWLLLSIGIGGGIIIFAWPTAAMMRIDYAPLSPTEPSPVRIEFNAHPPHRITSQGGGNDREITLNLPLKVSGVLWGTAVRLDGVMAEISAPNGLRWSSNWQSVYLRTYLPNTIGSSVDVKVSSAFLKQIRDLPVNIHLSLAISELRKGKVDQARIGEGEFSLPSGSICSLEDLTSSLSCRFPMRPPALTHFSTMLSHQPCGETESPDNPPTQAVGWDGTLDNSPADFGITSVSTSSLYLSEMATRPGQTFNRAFLCPGTPITITRYSLTGHHQLDLVISDQRLPNKPQNFY